MTKLSVCIPVYNFDCIELLQSLISQSKPLNLDFEIIIMDDASSINLDSISKFKHPCYKYIELEKNIGRAKIRNRLADSAQHNNLIFLDCDSKINDGFLKQYINIINNKKIEVVYGGTKDYSFKKKKTLRSNYGKKYEYLNHNVRHKNPYHNFRTNNFLIVKSVLKNTPFNENLTSYGHEDTFFSYQLQENNIKILHINNPVTHIENDTNTEYIKKIKSSIQNYFYLVKQYPNFSKFSKLHLFIDKYNLNKNSFITSLALPLSTFFEKIARTTSNASSFQLFKLFYTIANSKKHDK